ncbi:DAN domain family member 5 [Tachyglossus aculeatus]|uniref:DAN domain family member 5 n=1 Tax=Tachyglossus aculeatus TaxID=9261 RepID=UPI0018F44F52|nr:DAN domain family member 5 [Tachyglossus aculeatus]
MLISQLTALLSVLWGTQACSRTSELPPLFMPRQTPPDAPAPIPEEAAFQSPTLTGGSADGAEGLAKGHRQHPPPRSAQVSSAPTRARSSWEAFLGLQSSRVSQGSSSPILREPGKRGLLRKQMPLKWERESAMPLPLTPQDVTKEKCQAIPFTQVVSWPGCKSIKLQNKFCFGHCSSFYIPSATPLSSAQPHLCNSCMPARKRRVPVLLWCQTDGAAFHKQVKVAVSLVEGCRCFTHI